MSLTNKELFPIVEDVAEKLTSELGDNLARALPILSTVTGVNAASLSIMLMHRLIHELAISAEAAEYIACKGSTEATRSLMRDGLAQMEKPDRNKKLDRLLDKLERENNR